MGVRWTGVLNLLALFVVLGIGIDDVLVVVTTFRQTAPDGAYAVKIAEEEGGEEGDGRPEPTSGAAAEGQGLAGKDVEKAVGNDGNAGRGGQNRLMARRIAVTLEKAGASIFATSLTDFAAFAANG